MNDRAALARLVGTARAPVPSPPLPREVVRLGDRPVEVVWRRNARARRASLRVDPASGAVLVTLPPRTGRGAGLALLRANADWVAARLTALPTPIRVAAGALVPFCGEMRPIRHEPDARGGAWIAPDGALVASGGAEFLPRRIADLLRSESRQRLVRLVHEIGDPASLRPRCVSIKDTRTRWGSCTAAGVVMFTWRLVMAPPLVQHYVVAHELAHLRHLDHGRAFWSLVEALTPHRAAAEDWLKRHGPGLLRVG